MLNRYIAVHGRNYRTVTVNAVHLCVPKAYMAARRVALATRA